jgi:hypothetical protein
MMAAMSPLFAALLLLVPLAQAENDSPLGTIDGAQDQPLQHTISLGLRGGASFLVGGQGGAYAPGPAAGLLMDIPFSEYAGFSMDLGYATHRVRNANALFDPDGLVIPIDPANVTGSQHHYYADLGLRIDLSMRNPTDYRRKRVTVAPWFRFAAGFTMTDTLLDVASMGGREPVRTRKPHAVLCPSLGLTVNLPKLVSFRYSFQSVTMFGLDHSEVANTDALRTVFRFQPALDVLFRF